MRLHNVSSGHTIRRKVMMRVMGWVSGAPIPDVIRTLTYRPAFFGQPYSAWLQEVMRGPSQWSVGERELFAAFTSRQNACKFCATGHAAASSKALGDASLVQATLEDWRTAPLDGRVKAVLGLLEKVTLDPHALTEQDIDRVRRAGVSDAAIEEAVCICALFNMINRLADALDFDTSLSDEPEMVAKAANAMLRYGYKM